MSPLASCSAPRIVKSMARNSTSNEWTSGAEFALKLIDWVLFLRFQIYSEVVARALVIDKIR